MTEGLFHSWTADDDRAIASRLMDGKRPAVIAAELGTTKNAVIGRIHRSPLGLQQLVKRRGPSPKVADKAPAPGKPKATLPKPPKPTQPTPAPVRAAPARAEPVPVARPVPAPLGPMRLVPLIELKSHECKWPVEENRAVTGHFLFCARATGGPVYCAEHHAQALAGGGHG